MTKAHMLWLLVLAAAVWWIAMQRRAVVVNKQTGLVAAVDAQTANGYTTYNTQLYTPPAWTPLLRFFRAGAYVATTQNNSNPQVVDYSVQG